MESRPAAKGTMRDVYTPDLDPSGGPDTAEMKRGGRLISAKRAAIPSSDFALPGKGSGKAGKGAGSYPIPDAAHARNALARVAQHGTAEDKSAVRRRVARKYPGIRQSA